MQALTNAATPPSTSVRRLYQLPPPPPLPHPPPPPPKKKKKKKGSNSAYFFPENLFWYFMQIVSMFCFLFFPENRFCFVSYFFQKTDFDISWKIGDNLHEMSKPVFFLGGRGGGKKKNIINVLSAESAERVVKSKHIYLIVETDNHSRYNYLCCI